MWFRSLTPDVNGLTRVTFQEVSLPSNRMQIGMAARKWSTDCYSIALLVSHYYTIRTLSSLVACYLLQRTCTEDCAADLTVVLILSNGLRVLETTRGLVQGLVRGFRYCKGFRLF